MSHHASTNYFIKQLQAHNSLDIGLLCGTALFSNQHLALVQGKLQLRPTRQMQFNWPATASRTSQQMADELHGCL